MENTEITNVAISNCNIPTNWLYCFTNDCERRDTCVRYRAGLGLDPKRTWGHAVFPKACADGHCPHFKLLRVIRTAWGFGKMFCNVRVADAPLLRQQMRKMLGGNGTYYCYHHGTRRLTPEQQDNVKHVFARFGYDNVEFEYYRTEIDI